MTHAILFEPAQHNHAFARPVNSWLTQRRKDAEAISAAGLIPSARLADRTKLCPVAVVVMICAEIGVSTPLGCLNRTHYRQLLLGIDCRWIPFVAAPLLTRPR
jgi:hypothetical protein